MDPANFLLVILESPYAGRDPAEFIEFDIYLNRCLSDCLDRAEAPFASHAIYTRPGVRDDTCPDQRRYGVHAGFAYKLATHNTVVYTDYGISPGMQKGIDYSLALGHTIEYRQIGKNTRDDYAGARN